MISFLVGLVIGLVAGAVLFAVYGDNLKAEIKEIL